MADETSVGEKIAELRKKLTLTQSEFGDKVGVSRQAVANWERNISSPKADKILDICRAFGVGSDYFYGVEVEKVSEAAEVRAADNFSARSGTAPVQVVLIREKRGLLKKTMFVTGWIIALVAITFIIGYNVFNITSSTIRQDPALITFIQNFYIFILIVAFCLTALMIFLTVRLLLKKINERKTKA